MVWPSSFGLPHWLTALTTTVLHGHAWLYTSLPCVALPHTNLAAEGYDAVPDADLHRPVRALSPTVSLCSVQYVRIFSPCFVSFTGSFATDGSLCRLRRTCQKKKKKSQIHCGFRKAPGQHKVCLVSLLSHYTLAPAL